MSTYTVWVVTYKTRQGKTIGKVVCYSLDEAMDKAEAYVLLGYIATVDVEEREE